MKFSEIKKVFNFCESMDSAPYWHEVVENIRHGFDDFTVDGVRFISDDAILAIMVDEVFADGREYELGCIPAEFIAEYSDLNQTLLSSCQEHGAFEAIGQALMDYLSQDEMEEFCEGLAILGGYGIVFNTYDGESRELYFKTGDETIFYHAFDNRGY